jgi:hypothetical protein
MTKFFLTSPSGRQFEVICTRPTCVELMGGKAKRPKGQASRGNGELSGVKIKFVWGKPQELN